MLKSFLGRWIKADQRPGLIFIIFMAKFSLPAVRKNILSFAKGVIFFASTVCLAVLLCVSLEFILSLHRPISERSHTRYDAQLGWVNILNTTIRDFYQPGASLTINSQGLRNGYDFPARIPDGRMRIMCSGDSFTLGSGVGDEDTWPQQLAQLDPRFETVNLGQGGYGIDQSFLLYRREGVKLQHHLHIFAVIYDDFTRMSKDKFLGVYGKPVIQLENDQIKVKNVPVPQSAYSTPWLAENLAQARSLVSVQIVKGVLRFIAPGARSKIESRKSFPSLNLVLRVFEDLNQTEQEMNSDFLLVYLPTRADLEWEPLAAAALKQKRSLLGRKLAQRGIVFIDLVEDFEKFDDAQLNRLFIPENKFPFSAGHYSKEGNRYVAQLIYRKLFALADANKTMNSR